jgi:undecaprenyl-phosphate 4-deoxy-4-formamido-L-arabinose transferase
MELSIVVPVYRSAACLPELTRRVRDEVSRRFRDCELILVNDDSPDDSWDVIVRLTCEYPFVVGVNLRRNVGQDNAIMAGLRVATGDVIVIMDDDLQHDPADIAALYEQIQDGRDVAYARFDHKRQALWKNLGSWFNDRVATITLGKPRDVYMSPFKAIRREVAEEIAKYEGPYPYVDGLIFTVTSNLTQVPVTHRTRFAGRSNFNLLKSVAVWVKVVTGFSVIPLRLAMIVGGVMSIASFLLALYYVLETMILARQPAGYPSLIVSILFIGGVQLMGLGAIGEYVGRIFITQNSRPQFTVKEIRRGLLEHRSTARSAAEV